MRCTACNHVPPDAAPYSNIKLVGADCSEEQLLDESTSLQANQQGSLQLQTGWPHQDRARQRSSTNLVGHASVAASSQASPVTPQAGYLSSGHQHAVQQSAALEQLSQQLPGSFASMPTSFASPQVVQRGPQASLGPHDPAWFREGQVSQAQLNTAYQGSLLQQQQQQLQSLQPHTHVSSGHQGSLLQQQQQQQPAQSTQPQAWQLGLQTPGLTHQQQQQILLFAAQQQVMREQGADLQWDEQQQLLLTALQPQRDATSSLQQQLDLSEGASKCPLHVVTLLHDGWHGPGLGLVSFPGGCSSSNGRRALGFAVVLVHLVFALQAKFH